ncbi:nitrogenase-stabilizing/protective protein NifW [Marinobacterium zhoushanense]|uniref:Nitrogenase-stabilizing/protective protein NifW n=1 Tax=Marinobacterium zhoushanense TaxID=1679163 RepID=A0ABQ1KHG5_9GAMM|nr:nitrogenase-stabilizing/protective protein NifW [Marinobacterium zhoushanense]GGB96969.1 nitrogenase-stabilizing/protective protein NifW [Marinobacterium zhoushanense]
MSDFEFIEDLEELSSAEEFLDYFEIEFDAKVVMINRLHIMQRYHDYLQQAEKAGTLPDQESTLKEAYKQMLTQAYQDFVESDALTEKVFKVFHMHGPQTTFVPLDQLLES